MSDAGPPVPELPPLEEDFDRVRERSRERWRMVLWVVLALLLAYVMSHLPGT